MRPPPPLPGRIGPVKFTEFGRMVAVRCPRGLAHIMQHVGGVWDPGSRRWLVERRRIGPVIRALEAATDPLFRRAGMALDSAGPFYAARAAASPRPVPLAAPRELAPIHGVNLDEDAVKSELLWARRPCNRRGWPVIDVTRRSIEETAATVLQLMDAWHERRRKEAAARS